MGQGGSGNRGSLGSTPSAPAGKYIVVPGFQEVIEEAQRPRPSNHDHGFRINHLGGSPIPPGEPRQIRVLDHDLRPFDVHRARGAAIVGRGVGSVFYGMEERTVNGDMVRMATDGVVARASEQSVGMASLAGHSGRIGEFKANQLVVVGVGGRLDGWSTAVADHFGHSRGMGGAYAR